MFLSKPYYNGSDSCISSNRSAATCASHNLKGSALDDGLVKKLFNISDIGQSHFTVRGRLFKALQLMVCSFITRTTRCTYVANYQILIIFFAIIRLSKYNRTK